MIEHARKNRTRKKKLRGQEASRRYDAQRKMQKETTRAPIAKERTHLEYAIILCVLIFYSLFLYFLELRGKALGFSIQHIRSFPRTDPAQSLSAPFFSTSTSEHILSTASPSQARVIDFKYEMFEYKSDLLGYFRSIKECPDNAITNQKTDGFGAQYAAFISILAYSFANNLTFCVTPWKVMAHDLNGTDMFHFIGGEHYGPLARVDTPAIMEYVQIFKMDIQNSFYKKKFRHMIEFARQAYFSTPKPPLSLYSPSKFNVAIHIRRGDVGPKNIKRFTSNRDYVNCIQRLKYKYRDVENLDFYIFSERDGSNFSEIETFHPDVKFLLDTDVKATYHHMVMADVLVLARSEFSKTAGLISPKGDIFLVKQCLHL